MRPCVILDLDGTLANCNHRLHFIKQQPKDWKAFFDGMKDDLPYEYMVRLANAIRATYAVFICSGRPESHRIDTQRWLAKYGVPYDNLFMRSRAHSEARTPDVVVKKEMLDNIRDDMYDPFLAIDDRPDVIQMWRENGVPCLACDDINWRT